MDDHRPNREFEFPKIAVESASPSPMGNNSHAPTFSFDGCVGGGGSEGVDTMVTSTGGTVVVEDWISYNASPSRIPLLGGGRASSSSKQLQPKSWSFLSRTRHNNVAAAAAPTIADNGDSASDDRQVLQPRSVEAAHYDRNLDIRMQYISMGSQTDSYFQ